MPRGVARWIAGIGLMGLVALMPASQGLAEPTYMGPEACQKCHKSEVAVWEGTQHSKSLKKLHKTDTAKKVVKAIGDKRMKRSETCALCHYTRVAKGSKMKAVAGPSCESCHGPSSDWITMHNDYGSGVTQETESAEHKAARKRKAAEAGMFWPSDTLNLVMNCFACHGMTRDALDGDTIAKMMDAGHPINPDYELVRYSQGSVRHRFYPPDITNNAEMTPPETARMFVIGHAASLVTATKALGIANHPKYVAAQEARIAAATTALNAIKGSVPEAGALLQDPNLANAQALVAAIDGQDLSGAVGGLLPPKDSYK